MKSGFIPFFSLLLYHKRKPTMLQRDYFIRLIEEFNAAVSRFLVKKEDDLKRDKELKDLYRQYVGRPAQPLCRRPAEICRRAVEGGRADRSDRHACGTAVCRSELQRAALAADVAGESVLSVRLRGGARLYFLYRTTAEDGCHAPGIRRNPASGTLMPEELNNPCDHNSVRLNP